MIIYPTLELLDGKCVTLRRGELRDPVLWHREPLDVVRGWAREGASWVHVTDLNGLRGDGDNTALLEEIIRSAGVPVQMGGGFRTQRQVETWLDKGAGRIVASTMAAQSPMLLRELAKFYPDQIVMALDVHDGHVVTDGWRERSSFSPASFLEAFEADPLAGIIVTDVGGMIGDGDGALGVITGLAAQTRHSVIARGTVRSVDDVARLRYVPNIAGTMIGQALMSRDVDLAEAIGIAAAPLEPVAPFQ
ncbi:1-(5-phosphoribosyl)-5-[(5-phosphoribosylamino)methylideneamino]imidazole-4-carboxamide isomerase [Roseovarius aquimarinus]|uniref:1-(5-phosphoribosyl)-5-[(5-phosphoribosylamino)methylideneamino] imidazole-4-carboxamide isomerase n=1 Tax=Roseovarius aquimarinus TaxID=1229156 RepID=A0ABW7I715_9RHOB